MIAFHDYFIIILNLYANYLYIYFIISYLQSLIALIPFEIRKNNNNKKRLEYEISKWTIIEKKISVSLSRYIKITLSADYKKLKNCIYYE